MADIVLKDRQGVPQTYAGYSKVAFNTPDSGTVIFSEGDATENVPIDLNLADGDQTVAAESGTLIKSAVIKKPTTLTPDNIAKDVNVAGVVGTFIGNSVENVEIIPDFSAGDQTVTAESDTFIKSAIVRKPETLIPENIAKGVNVAGITGTLSGAQPAVEKDVNFYDYDGTCVASYTISEIQALDVLPDGPEHDGLTFQGWNATLDEIKSKNEPLDVSAMFITSDGKTRIHITLSDGRTSPRLGIAINGTVDVDWGDGSEHSTLTGTSSGSAVYTPVHDYPSAGNYVITLTITGSSNIFGDSSKGSLLLSPDSSLSQSIQYRSCIKKVNLGVNVGIGPYAFQNCYSLRFISVPSTITNIQPNAFRYCYSLSYITIPNSVTHIYNYAFYYCYSLHLIPFPSSLTNIGESAFYGCSTLNRVTFIGDYVPWNSSAFNSCYALSSLSIPKNNSSIGTSSFSYCYSLKSIIITPNITVINNRAFEYCYSLGKIVFTRDTPPIINYSPSQVFSNLPTDCVIYVPNDSYLTATNYPSPDTYTYIVGGNT